MEPSQPQDDVRHPRVGIASRQGTCNNPQRRAPGGCNSTQPASSSKKLDAASNWHGASWRRVSQFLLATGAWSEQVPAHGCQVIYKILNRMNQYPQNFRIYYISCFGPWHPKIFQMCYAMTPVD